jgi:hypothetical protein
MTILFPFIQLFSARTGGTEFRLCHGNNWESHTFDRIGILSSRISKQTVCLINECLYLFFSTDSLSKDRGNRVPTLPGITGNHSLLTESEFCPPEHQKQSVCLFNILCFLFNQPIYTHSTNHPTNQRNEVTSRLRD